MKRKIKGYSFLVLMMVRGRALLPSPFFLSI
nr:MAG TPA: hypothetical protein [Caudoviricetes sp.]